VEGGGGGFTLNGVLRNRGGFVKCVAIQKKKVGDPCIRLYFPITYLPTLALSINDLLVPCYNAYFLVRHSSILFHASLSYR
jgi:hypothetical protein